MTNPLIELRGATKRFPGSDGGIHTAVRNLHFTVAPGEFVAVVGPTGCGKSTTLSLVSGLEKTSAGRTLVRGKDVDGIPAGVGYMFQQDAVLPWRTVLDNVALGPRFQRVPKAQARQRASEWVRTVGLAGFENYYPHQLSGGMRKRVALAQTLVNEPEIILMDEPFSALDVQTRQLMQDELLRVWSGTGAAVIFVTHDLEEAIVLADRVVVMTASPATVCGDFRVTLERPRTVEEVRLTEEFRDLYSEIWGTLRDQVEAARAKGARRVA
ncbi:ABC transporter ATP-binding protein [Nocardia terpenica]|uniref:ABC transporter ATP-binding protein n=1 Tax=Nocardia terpenica TaxID=455432 RepID=UPI0018930E56|nr:ABC transporter ATP-binding protein [Nocardia terpenica]MBF6064445.1 ABC transporter ATP-binding protein [Nocardia terpenica]MBF6106931.1 ABC transporter ATP-binding protein [Nocardia terpenica]MBF6114413.1 ABC transporter ATP-binding protein [Nocardia terpenica]MBF6121501.1 ABC transporter ATP-binding protein [Nocardia terpenica]MBF6153916.1 ABC transporter ATP-binding protein [Nocardia terpenica]